MPNDRRPFSTLHPLSWFAGVTIAVLAAACSDTAAPPVRAVSPDISDAIASYSRSAATLPNAAVAQGLLREKPLAREIVVTKVIHPGGGKIEISEADFELEIPKKAFDGPKLEITVRARPGNVVAYEFEPHGIVFNQPLRFTQKLGHTNLKGVKLPPGFQAELSGAYFPNPNWMDSETGLAVVTEFLPADLTWTKDELSFPIWHFSGYMISTGRH